MPFEIQRLIKCYFLYFPHCSFHHAAMPWNAAAAATWDSRCYGDFWASILYINFVKCIISCNICLRFDEIPVFHWARILPWWWMPKCFSPVIMRCHWMKYKCIITVPFPLAFASSKMTNRSFRQRSFAPFVTMKDRITWDKKDRDIQFVTGAYLVTGAYRNGKLH